MGKRTLNINNIQVHHETFLRHYVSTVLPLPVHELTTHTKLTRQLQFPTEALYLVCSNLSSWSVYPTHPLHLSQMRSNSSSLLTKASCLSSAEASFPTWNVCSPVVSVKFHGSFRASQILPPQKNCPGCIKFVLPVTSSCHVEFFFMSLFF